MIFLTRELYKGMQPGSSWERRAENQFERRADQYRRYFEVIAPLLPATARRLCQEGLHDSVVLSASQKNGDLMLDIDATNALGKFRGRTLRLVFKGVRRKIPCRKLCGQWWLYEEAHLSSQSRFSLHVMFDETDVELEADELLIGKV